MAGAIPHGILRTIAVAPDSYAGDAETSSRFAATTINKLSQSRSALRVGPAAPDARIRSSQRIAECFSRRWKVDYE